MLAVGLKSKNPILGLYWGTFLKNKMLKDQSYFEDYGMFEKVDKNIFWYLSSCLYIYPFLNFMISCVNIYDNLGNVIFINK